jgi:hypothetical protein
MTLVKVVAEYQMMTDDDAATIMRERLSAGVAAGQVESFDLTGTYVGQWGVVLCDFTVLVNVNPDWTWQRVKDYTTDLLNGIIFDTDVTVRWVCALP